MHQYFLLVTLFLLFSCTQKKQENPNLITAHQVGKLTDSTQVWQLEKLFPNDSIVVRLEEGAFVEAPDDSYLIYSKNGELLFTAIANIQGDSTATFRKVIIASSIFKTNSGLNCTSYFVDIKNNKPALITKSDIAGNKLFLLDTMHIELTIDRNKFNVNSEQLKIPDSLQIDEFIVNWEN